MAEPMAADRPMSAMPGGVPVLWTCSRPAQVEPADRHCGNDDDSYVVALTETAAVCGHLIWICRNIPLRLWEGGMEPVTVSDLRSEDRFVTTHLAEQLAKARLVEGGR
jgi:hypothetical protein